MQHTRPENPLISIVVPVRDEEGCVDELVRRINLALTEPHTRCEILFVDDGSQDGTAEKIAALRKLDPSVRSIRFTRSFGHQAALAAGMRHARGDAIVTMDGDLQHPPELLPRLIDAWRAGAEVVQSVRRGVPGTASLFKERTAMAFYRVMTSLSRLPVVPAGADFRLLDRRVVDSFNNFQEHFLFTRGLIPWMGFSETLLEYEVGERYAGESKYWLWPMLRLALDGIFSFSVMPLRLISLLGFGTTLSGVAFGIFWLVSHLTGRVEGSGWTSVVVLILIFGGVQLLSIGIMAEYVGRTYEEAKRRPRYVIESSSDPLDD